MRQGHRHLRGATPGLILALLLLPLLGPPAARAAPHKIHSSVPEIVFETIDSPASNGYRFEAQGHRVHYSQAERERFTDGAPAFVTTFFLTLKRGPAEALYLPGEPVMSGGTTAAHLGALGDVSLRFVPHAVTRRREEKGCTGPAQRIEHGVFVGLLRFDGEGGYTRLLRRRLPGTVTRQPPLHCDLAPTEVHEHGRTRVGGSSYRGRDNSISFSAERLSPAGAASFDASETEQRGELSIFRAVSVKGPAGSVLIDDGLTTATVTPPAPFEGEARFEADKGK